MRIQLRPPRDTSDHGAIAVVVALLALVIFGLAAFAVDFGLAYTSKRNLQKGADAAALAAASEIIKRASPTDSCSAVASNFAANVGGLRGAVEAVADSYSDANRNAASRLDMQVRCSSDNKRVEVLYQAGGTTPRLFGGIFGSGDYATSRTAVADVFVPASGQGLRPYFLCLPDLTLLQAAQSSSPGWVRIRYPALDAAACGDYPGNWYTSDCPLDGNNGTLDENTLNGCLSEVSIIAPSNPSVGVTQADVIAACTGLSSQVPAFCLGANPGNVVAQPVVNAWTFLMTLPSIGVPVFDKTWKTWADTSAPDCQTGGVGNNGCYPIKALAGVKVCGYKWNNKDGVDPEEALAGSPCNGVAADLASLAHNDNKNYLWLKLVSVQLTGGSTPSGCALGDVCDAAARGTRLVE